MNKIVRTFIIVSLVGAALCLDPLGPLRAFVQSNLVGLPVLHRDQSWGFDAGVAQRRRRQFIALHGDKGSRLVERLGLGVDGFDERRLEMQRARDEGHLGGLNHRSR